MFLQGFSGVRSQCTLQPFQSLFELFLEKFELPFFGVASHSPFVQRTHLAYDVEQNGIFGIHVMNPIDDDPRHLLVGGSSFACSDVQVVTFL